MQRIIEKGWRHIALWGGIIVFMLVAPGIYDEFLAAEGMPLPESGNPAPVNDSRVHTDIYHLVAQNELGLYRLQGWAFLDNEKRAPAHDYTRQVVLYHPTGMFAFDTETVLSFDVDLNFKSLGMDLTRAGFSTLIYEDGLAPGMYSAGIFLTPRSGGESAYSFLGVCLLRTPNRLVLKDETDPGCYPLESGFGKPVAADAALPGPTTERKLWVETLTPAYSGKFYRIQGWAFLTVDKTIPAGGYDRQLVLVGSRGNYVFAADIAVRPDVDEYFRSEGMDLSISGFSAFIDPFSLPGGVYGIGLMFFEKGTGAAYYVDAGRCLQLAGSEMALAPNGSAVCRRPYLTGESLPAAGEEGKSA